jgi:hypothetical protein
MAPGSNFRVGASGRGTQDHRQHRTAYEAPSGGGARRARTVRTVGVALPEGVRNPREAFRQELEHAVGAHPESFTGNPIPERPGDFKRDYVGPVVEFEVNRQTGMQRIDVAETYIEHGLDFYRYGHPLYGEMSVREAVGLPVEPLPRASFSHPRPGDARGYPVGVTFEGVHYATPEEMRHLTRTLTGRGLISPDAATALHWVSDYAHSEHRPEGRQGRVNVRDSGMQHSYLYVANGGTAELSNVGVALESGFDVFTTHRQSPSLERLVNRVADSDAAFGGRLIYAQNGTNLLTQLPETAATMVAAAEGRRLIVDHTLYAPGGGRETFLGVATDGLNHVLGPRTDVLVYRQSPSAGAHEISAELAQEIIETQGSGNIVERNGRYFVISIATFQAESYQNQNLRKRFSAEVARTRGLGPAEGRHPTTASVNVGPIADTASMDTPFIQNAFTQAGRDGVVVADPLTFRQIMWHLQLHDTLNPDAPSQPRGGENEADAARGLHTQHVDFGVYRIGRDFDSMISRAGLRGVLRHPIAGGGGLLRDSVPVVGRVANAFNTAAAPGQVEGAISRMQGPLARAFTGGEDARPVRAIHMGDANIIPANGPRAMAAFSGMNGVWGLGTAAQLLAGQRMGTPVYGNALTTHVFDQLLGHRTGDNDRIELISHPRNESALQAVRVHRTNGQHVEWVLTREQTPEGLPVVRQVIHFGRGVPSLEDVTKEASFTSMDFSYDSATGALRSLGSNQVNPAILRRPIDIELPGFDARQAREYAHMIDPGITTDAVMAGVTTPANMGALDPVLRRLVLDPQSGIDFSRVMVHSLSFRGRNGRPAALVDGPPIRTTVTPTDIIPTDKGEIVRARIDVTADRGRGPFNTAVVDLIVRNNFPLGRDGEGVVEETRVRDSHWDRAMAEAGHEPIPLITMTRGQLPHFARLNGDRNPLHQVDAVGWAAGQPGIVNPGFGTMAQVDAALMARFGGQPLSSLSGRLIRPALPNRAYQVEYSGGPGQTYGYQVVDPKPNKKGERRVIIDGQFTTRGRPLGN